MSISWEPEAPKLWDLMPDDLRKSRGNSNNNRKKKYTINVRHLNHPETILPPSQSVEKLSSMKLVPGAKKAGVCCRELQVPATSWIRPSFPSPLLPAGPGHCCPAR